MVVVDGEFENIFGWRVQVIEIIPPLVDTDLHRDAQNPEGYSTVSFHRNFTNGMYMYNLLEDWCVQKTNPHALSQEQFIADIEEGWSQGLDEVAAGTARDSENWNFTNLLKNFVAKNLRKIGAKVSRESNAKFYAIMNPQ